MNEAGFIFAFTTKKGADVLVALDGKPVRAGATALDSKLAVLDAPGNQLVGVFDYATDNNTGSGSGSLSSSSPNHKAQGLVFRPPSTGRYYVKVVAGGRTAAAFTAAGACGCGNPDKDDNLNGVADCLNSADLKALLSNLLSQQKGLSLKKKDATQKSLRSTFTATLNAIRAYSTKSALAKITVKKSYKTLRTDLRTAVAAGRSALKAKTATQLRVARAAARRARKNIIG